MKTAATTIVAVPEPGPIVLGGMGLALFMAWTLAARGDAKPQPKERGL